MSDLRWPSQPHPPPKRVANTRPICFRTFWKSTPSVSLWALTMSARNRCNRSVFPCEEAPSSSWGRTPWCGRPSRGTWNPMPRWRNCCPTSRGMLALSSPMAIWLKFGTNCWRTKSGLRLVLAPLPHCLWWFQPRIPGYPQKKHPSSKLWVSPRKFQRVSIRTCFWTHLRSQFTWWLVFFVSETRLLLVLEIVEPPATARFCGNFSWFVICSKKWLTQ